MSIDIKNYGMFLLVGFGLTTNAQKTTLHSKVSLKAKDTVVTKSC